MKKMGKQIKKQIKKTLKTAYGKSPLSNDKGVSLVELVVVFALMSIFILMSTQAIANAMQLYYRMQSQSYGIQVTDLLMSKIQGELSKAVETVPEDGEGEDTIGVNISADNTSVDFWNGSGSHILITSKDGYLQEKYYGMAADDEEEGSAATGVADTFFEYDKRSYMGFQIQELKFFPAGGEYPDHVIKVVLVLEHPQYVGYRCERYISCYNMEH